MKKKLLSANELRNILKRKLQEHSGYFGYNIEHAVEEFLVEEKLGGSGSGISYFLRFFDSLQSNFKSPPQVTERGIFTDIDAGGGLAHVPFANSFDNFCKKTSENGIGVITIRNNITFIRAGYPAYLLGCENLISLCFIFVNKNIACPSGMSKPLLGTNPIAFCAPTSDKPILYDSATTSISGGQLQKLKLTASGQDKCFGADNNGLETTLISEIHSLLPIGGDRGLGLMLIPEILAGSLLNYNLGSKKNSLDDFGVFILAISPDFFGSTVDFKERNSGLVEELKNGGAKHIPGCRYPEKQELNSSYLIPDNLYRELIAC